VIAGLGKSPLLLVGNEVHETLIVWLGLPYEGRRCADANINWAGWSFCNARQMIEVFQQAFVLLDGAIRNGRKHFLIVAIQVDVNGRAQLGYAPIRNSHKRA